MKAEFVESYGISADKEIIGQKTFLMAAKHDALPEVSNEERVAGPASARVDGTYITKVDLFDDDDSRLGDFQIKFVFGRNDKLKLNNGLAIAVGSDSNDDVVINVENLYLTGKAEVYTIEKKLFDFSDLCISIMLIIETFESEELARINVVLTRKDYEEGENNG